MAKCYWYCCVKCNEVNEYCEFEDGTSSFPRGEWLAHEDFIVTGFKTRDEAEAGLSKYAYLLKTGKTAGERWAERGRVARATE